MRKKAQVEVQLIQELSYDSIANIVRQESQELINDDDTRDNAGGESYRVQHPFLLDQKDGFPRVKTLDQINSGRNDEEVENYNNPLVSRIYKQCGVYNYDQEPNHGEDPVEYRAIKELEIQAKYEGEWITGKDIRQGKGKLIWSDGSMYEGWWMNNMTNGRGRLIHADGDVYDGQWLNDKQHGYGQYFHVDGSKYEGFWNQGQYHGQG